MYHGTGRPRAPVARRMQRPRIMSDATMEWTRDHTHPQGSWWQYVNDRRQARLVFIGLGLVSILVAFLTVWMVRTG